MVDFAAVALSPMAIAKFFHTVLSSWILGAVFVVGISCWYLLRNRQKEFALSSIKSCCRRRFVRLSRHCMDGGYFGSTGSQSATYENGCR